MTLEATMARLVAMALARWAGSDASCGGPYAGSFSSEAEVDREEANVTGLPLPPGHEEACCPSAATSAPVAPLAEGPTF
jgi:hypothetical protein